MVELARIFRMKSRLYYLDVPGKCDYATDGLLSALMSEVRAGIGISANHIKSESDFRIGGTMKKISRVPGRRQYCQLPGSTAASWSGSSSTIYTFSKIAHHPHSSSSTYLKKTFPPGHLT